MEKRLALAILLSLVVLIGFELTKPAVERQVVEPQPETGGELVQSQPAGVGGSPVESGAGTTGEPAQLAAAEEQELTLQFDDPGAVGHFQARFTNRGAELIELRTGSYYRRIGLDEAGRNDPSNWLPLIEDVRYADGSKPAGGFALEPLTSARELAPDGLGDMLWTAERLTDAAGADSGVVFRYAGANGVRFEKRFERVPGTWELDFTLSIASPDTLPEGLQPSDREFAMVAGGTVGVEVDDPFAKQPLAVAVGPYAGSSFDIESQVGDLGASKTRGVLDVPAPLAVVGGQNKYFAALLRGRDEAGRTALRGASWRRFDAIGLVPPGAEDRASADGASVEPVRESQGYVVADAQLLLELPPAGSSKSWGFRLFAGPKDHGDFLDATPAHREVLNRDLSFFSGIGNFLIDVLVVIHSGVGNWGVSIILLTLLIRTILFPLNRRSQTALAQYQSKMKRIQPKMDAIKQKYKDDPQGLREAQGKLMQEERAFPPLGGCLPMFLQMPIFFGLFAALRTSFDLRHAGFVGWIQDLSRPDQLFHLGFSVPFFGEYFNLLPPLMVVMWIWQQKSMPQPTDEQARQMQRIMLFMPVVMGVFLYNYAAGLSLYMVTQSTLGIIEQKVIKKIWPLNDAEPEPKQKKGCAPFADAMQRAAEQQAVRQKELEKQRAQLKNRKQARKKK